MLGIGSSISSVVENKYNISLNGTSDYINIDSFTQHADLANGMAWSLAVWFKGNGSATSGAHTNILFSAHSSDASNRLRIGIDADGTKGVYYSDAQETRDNIGNVDLDDGNWHLVVISRPSGLDQTLKVYIDGSSNVSTVANTEVLWDSDLTYASIGQEYDPASPTVASDFFGGEIAQLAFWKTDLDSDDVDAIYNAGRNADLNTPQVDYQDHGSIIGYWKMGDGLFDDKVNGVVHDQANPGFGSELVLNGDFEELGDELVTSGDFSDFVVQGGDVTITNGTASFKDGGTNPNSRVGLDVLDANKTYKVVFSVTRYVAGNVQMIFGGGDTFSIDITGGVDTYTVYVVCGSSTSVSIKRNGGYPNFDFDLTNVSIKQVDPNDYWNLTIGNPTIEEGVAIFPDSTSSYFIQVNVADLTVKNYKLTYEVVSTNGNNFRLAGGNSAFGTVTLDSATIGKKTVYLTSNGSKKSLQFNNNAFIGSFTNVSVKKLNDSYGLVTGAAFVAGN